VPTRRRSHAAPDLSWPPDWWGFKGRDEEVILSWQPSGKLAADEFYLVETHTGPNLEHYNYFLVKDTEVKLPPIVGHVEYWTTFGQVTAWTVTVVRASGNQVQEKLGPPSVTRHLVWTEVT
jgi:hypothetical protein